MSELSTKPYLIRAIYEWCSDSGLTPYLSVKVDANTRVPNEFVKDGEIILNISHDASHHLTLGNDVIQFSARIGGVSRDSLGPVNAVQGVFAKETSQGLLFTLESETGSTQAEADNEESGDQQPSPDSPSPKSDKRRFQVIK
jgi:stringent starvation protein B